MQIKIEQLPPPESSPNYHGHWINRYQANRVYGLLVFYCCVEVRNRLGDDFKPIESGCLDLTFIFAEARVRDRDNMIARFKPGLDAVVRAGLLIGDDSEHLRVGNVHVVVNKDIAPLTIIELTEEVDQ